MSLKLATPSQKWVKSHAMNSNPFFEGGCQLQTHFFKWFLHPVCSQLKLGFWKLNCQYSVGYQLLLSLSLQAPVSRNCTWPGSREQISAAAHGTDPASCSGDHHGLYTSWWRGAKSPVYIGISSHCVNRLKSLIWMWNLHIVDIHSVDSVPVCRVVASCHVSGLGRAGGDNQ